MSWKKIITEKFNQQYEGHAEACEWTFAIPLPKQIGAEALANRMIDGHVQELQKQGSILLELHVWEDSTSLIETQYLVKTVASASPLFWKILIVGVVIAILIIGITWMLIKVEDIVTYIGSESSTAMKWMMYATGAVIILGIGVGLVSLARRKI